MALTDAAKEQIKIQATFLNNIGVGFFLVGFLAPVMAETAKYLRSGVVNKGTLIVGAICGVLGVCIHIFAVFSLRRLNRDPG